jgi:hypothetical protein
VTPYLKRSADEIPLLLVSQLPQSSWSMTLTFAYNLSARFRIKRKQKTFNLERSVSDLTGRAEELEREATDLKRENKWLKEIVIMKAAARSTDGRQENSGDNVAPHKQ